MSLSAYACPTPADCLELAKEYEAKASATERTDLKAAYQRLAHAYRTLATYQDLKFNLH